MDEFLGKIDWTLLRDEKLTLLTTIDRAEHDDNDLALVPEDDRDNMMALVHLIDVIQDMAAEQGHPVVWLTEEEN